MNALQKSRAFLEVADQFKLGALPTETPHPKTRGLDQLAKTNLVQGIAVLKDLDTNLLDVLWQKRSELIPLMTSVQDTLESGHRIYLCGCGATGRLSLVLETLWREHCVGEWKDRIVSFMAGGDCAFIKSIEKFEDFPEYGARQLLDLGFKDGDLLISTTEGGETPFVIGATEKAADVSSRSPYFLYCNPDDVLVERVERSRRVIENSHIYKINLYTGPMGLTGSTRMQASSILMLAVGLALYYRKDQFADLEKDLMAFKGMTEKLDFSFLVPFIEKESAIYQKDEYLVYQCDESLGISIITDTTERSPTFSLYGFENFDEAHPVTSWSYLYFPHAADSAQAWEKLFRRAPRTFNWPDVNFQTDYRRLLGFDFSSQLLAKRKHLQTAHQHFFKIYRVEKGISFELDGINFMLEASFKNNLFEHTLLKFLLNIHSTLVMGRMNRYRSNIMTWVRPSNNKLIDRTVRFVTLLLEEQGIQASYDQLVLSCFEALEKLPHDESIVEFLVSSYHSKMD